MAVALLEGKRLKETRPVLMSKKVLEIFFFLVVVVHRLFLLWHVGLAALWHVGS